MPISPSGGSTVALPSDSTSNPSGSNGVGNNGNNGKSPVKPDDSKPLLKRFYGTVEVDPMRINRDAAAIANEVVQHLTALRGATVRISLEIHADIPDGTPDDTARTVMENCRTLKFNNQSFEQE